MNLFNEYYSSEVQCLLNLYSLNRTFTVEEAEDCAREAGVYSASGDYKELLRRWEVYGLIARDGAAYRVGPEFRPFAAPLNALETECLSELCRAGAAPLFLPDALRERLRRLFPSAGDTDTGMSARSVSDGEETASAAKCSAYDGEEAVSAAERSTPAEDGKPDYMPEAESFHTALDAIANGRRIGYTYQTRGEARHAEVSPWRIEYNALDGRWWLISYWEEQERTVKSRLDRLRDVRILAQNAVSKETIHQAIVRHLAPEPVVLRIAGEGQGKLRNVVERCFIGFENMLETTAVMLSETEYELSFRYFRWDDRLIIRKLLALGEYVTILSPKNLVNLMTDDLRTSLMRYQSG